MNIPIIYKTINLINGKIYIGQDSKNKINYFGSGKYLKYAIKKYGKENFKKEIIEICDSVKTLDDREIYWIKKLNSTNKKIGYNICEGGRVNRTMAGKNHPMYGKHHSKNTRKKISENTKKAMTDEIKKIIKEKRKYQVFSKETRALWSKHRTGKGNAMYGRKGKLSPNFGTHCSEERKQKISKAKSGKNNGMYGMCGEKNTSARKYIIRTPAGDIIEVISRKEVCKMLGCSHGFLYYKKFKGYKLLKSIKIYKKQSHKNT